MKKLLLLLLCVPLMFSCGENEKNNTGNSENNCDVKPDYTMSAVDFLKMIQTSNDKFHGKIFEINVEFGMRFISVGTEVGSIIDPEASFMYVNSFKYNYTGRLDFKLLSFTKNDEDYWEKLDELTMKGAEPVFKIKGTLVREKSDTSSNVYEFINCCLVIPKEQKDNIPEDICDIKADFILTAEQIENEYKKNKDITDKKYKGKIIQVTGDKCGSGKNNNTNESSYIQLCNKSRFNFQIDYIKLKEYTDTLPRHKTRYGTYQFVTIKGVYNQGLQFEKSCIVLDKINREETTVVIPPIVRDEKYKDDTRKENSLYGEINDPDGYTNVREEKSSKSDIVFKVYQGEEFEIIDNRDDNWWLIEYDGEQGYIYSDRIDLIK